MLKKTILPAVLGNANEWYDYALYGYFATILAQLFFPTNNKAVSLILIFAVFFTGFIARPFGAILFGHIGDRLGRRFALLNSIVLMGVSTTAIGLLPTYHSIGIVAPILLIILRILQGLAVSGELSGASTYLIESSTKHRGLMSSLIMSSVYFGQLMGALISWLISVNLSHAQLLNWGWRIPFLISAVFATLIFILRIHSDESPDFAALKQQQDLNHIPIKLIYQNHFATFFRIIGMICVAAVAGYLLVGFLPTFLLTQAHLSYHQVFFVNSSIMLTVFILLPLVGFLADYFGTKIFLLIGCCGFLFFALPIFHLLSQNNIDDVFCGAMFFAILISCINGVTTLTTAELFPTYIRQSGIGISFNVSLVLFGGTAPLVAQWLLQQSGHYYFIAIYLMIAALISLPIICKLPNAIFGTETARV